MFRDDLFFLTPEQLISWNRVHGAPGCVNPSYADIQRVESIKNRVSGPDKIRTESGARPYYDPRVDNED